jgi:hypothetical protein
MRADKWLRLLPGIRARMTSRKRRNARLTSVPRFLAELLLM